MILSQHLTQKTAEGHSNQSSKKQQEAGVKQSKAMLVTCFLVSCLA
jgi:hypothetical protein